jgi:hypothetical protein
LFFRMTRAIGARVLAITHRPILLGLGALALSPAGVAAMSTQPATAADWEVCTLDDFKDAQFETHYSCPDSGSSYIHQFVSPIADDGSIGPMQIYVWRRESASARGVTPPATGDTFLMPYAKSVTYDASDGATYQRWQVFNGPERCWRTNLQPTLQIIEVSPQNCDTTRNPPRPLSGTLRP